MFISKNLQDVILYFGTLIFLEYVVLVVQGKPTPRFNDTLTSISVGLFQECFRYDNL
jgi:hypothetical protein